MKCFCNIVEIAQFMCALYGRPRFKSVDAACAAMLKVLSLEAPLVTST